MTWADVLMVWHAYMLNPRCFLEDCIRYNKVDFYMTPFPLQHIIPCIDSVTFDYTPPDRAVARFMQATGLHWDNLEGPMVKHLRCPSSYESPNAHYVDVPWTTCAGVGTDGKVEPGQGYADSELAVLCDTCSVRISHEYLRTQKFRKDLLAWKSNKWPLPGTIIGRDG
jgi:hypothetical protein